MIGENFLKSFSPENLYICVWEECGCNPQDRNFLSTTFIIIYEKLKFYYLLLIQALVTFYNPQYCFQQHIILLWFENTKQLKPMMCFVAPSFVFFFLLQAKVYFVSLKRGVGIYRMSSFHTLGVCDNHPLLFLSIQIYTVLKITASLKVV